MKFFHLDLENRVCPEIFHCIEYIFFHSGFLSNLRLPWKTECALNSLHWIYIFYHSGFLSNLCLPWKTELPWNFSLYWNIFYHSGFLSNLRLPWKQRLPWIHCIEYIFFIIQDFWATCTSPENRGCPEIFQDRGRPPLPPPPDPPPRTPMFENIICMTYPCCPDRYICLFTFMFEGLQRKLQRIMPIC